MTRDVRPRRAGDRLEAADAPLRVVGDDDDAARRRRRARGSSRPRAGSGVVKPASTVMPCTPMKSRSTWSERIAVTAIGPTSASDGVRTPPVSTTVRSARARRVQDVGDLHRVRHDRQVGHVARGGGRAARSSCRRSAPIAWPGSTSSRGRARDRLLLRRAARCDFASNPGSSALQAAAARRAAVHLLDEPRRGEHVEVAADRHVARRRAARSARSRGPRPSRRTSSTISFWRCAREHRVEAWPSGASKVNTQTWRARRRKEQLIVRNLRQLR